MKVCVLNFETVLKQQLFYLIYLFKIFRFFKKSENIQGIFIYIFIYIHMYILSTQKYHSDYRKFSKVFSWRGTEPESSRCWSGAPTMSYIRKTP